MLECGSWGGGSPKYSRDRCMAGLPRLTKEQVLYLAGLAGLELDDLRAETIAARLGSVLDELDAVPGDTLFDVEPLPTFIPPAKERHG